MAKGMNGSALSAPPNTSDGMDHGKSNPTMGVSERPKNHGWGYPLEIDSIDRANPSHGPAGNRGKSNAHGYSYPGHKTGSKGGAKNASPKPTKKSKNIVG